MTKKLYNFWLYPFDKFHQSEEHPYSSYNGNPKDWANALFHYNPVAKYIAYKSVDGRKVYLIDKYGDIFVAKTMTDLENKFWLNE